MRLDPRQIPCRRARSLCGRVATGLLAAVAIVAFLGACAPSPWGIALNHQTRQCAGFWPGDEYARTSLPSGWQAYYPDYSSRGRTIQTDIGGCEWDSSRSADRATQAEECCRQLGYTFVPGNIGVSRPSVLSVIMIALVVGAILIALGLIVALLVGLFVGGRWLWKRLTRNP